MGNYYITPSGNIANAGIVMLSAKELLVKQLNIEAQNLSNGDTVGFKEVLQGGLESVYKNPRLGNKTFPVSYVQSSKIKRNFDQGTLKNTENPFEFAVNGPGYFALDVDGTTQYTRDGRFRLDETGSLVTIDGRKVQGENGDINLSGFVKFFASRDGAIIGVDQNDTQTALGKIKVVTFSNEQDDLEYMGLGRFLAKGEPQGTNERDTQIMQGFVEQSNVNPISGTIRLMLIMQRYQESQRITEMDDDAKSRAINLRINA